MGPETFLLYLSRSLCLQMHCFCLLPLCPQGQGFIAAIKIKFEGKIAEPFALETDTKLSSSGCLNASENSFFKFREIHLEIKLLYGQVLPLQALYLPPPPIMET